VARRWLNSPHSQLHEFVSQSICTVIYASARNISIKAAAISSVRDRTSRAGQTSGTTLKPTDLGVLLEKYFPGIVIALTRVDKYELVLQDFAHGTASCGYRRP
jgi:hypothetical protein